MSAPSSSFLGCILTSLIDLQIPVVQMFHKLTLLWGLLFALLLLHDIETWELNLPMKAEAKKTLSKPNFPMSFVTNLLAPFGGKHISFLCFCLLLTYV